MKNNLCYYCKIETNGNAGNPDLWPIYFCHPEHPAGMSMVHCTQCVTDRMIKFTKLIKVAEKLNTHLPFLMKEARCESGNGGTIDMVVTAFQVALNNAKGIE